MHDYRYHHLDRDQTFRLLARSLTTDDKREQLKLNPHYSDDRFNSKVSWKAQTVFGLEPEDRSGHPELHYVYSDRLEQWDYSKSQSAWQKALDARAPRDSAEFLEVYLATYFGKPLEVVHVMAGVNCSTGYSYWVAGYREKAPS